MRYVELERQVRVDLRLAVVEVLPTLLAGVRARTADGWRPSVELSGLIDELQAARRAQSNAQPVATETVATPATRAIVEVVSFSSAAAAHRLGVTSAAVTKAARKGRFPGAEHDVSGAWSIPVDAVERYEARRVA